MRGLERHIVVDHDGFQASVEDDGEGRVLDASHEHGLIGELILRAAQPAQVLTKFAPRGLASRTHEQDFKIRPMRSSPIARTGETIAYAGAAFFIRLPFTNVLTIRVRQQSGTDGARQAHGAGCVARCGAVNESIEEGDSGICIIVFPLAQIVEGLGDALEVRVSGLPLLGCHLPLASELQECSHRSNFASTPV